MYIFKLFKGSYMFFSLTAVKEYENSNKVITLSQIYENLKHLTSEAQRSQKTDGSNWIVIPKILIAIISANLLVTLIWKIKPAQTFMWRYFTNSFASSLFIFFLITI